MMANSSTSSLTSTSHTLTATAPYSSMAPGSGLPSLGEIASALAFRDTIHQSARRETLVKPVASLPTASTQITQVALGAFAGQVADEQQESLRRMHAASAARKRPKRTDKHANIADIESADKTVLDLGGPVGPILKIRRVHVDGFEIPQIWQQASRILETTAQQVETGMLRLDEAEKEEKGALPSDVDEEDDERDMEDEEVEEFLSEDQDEDEVGSQDLEDGFDDEDEKEDENGDEVEEDNYDLENGPCQDLVEDTDGLNDGFFDLDNFNKQSAWFEAQDAKADPKTDVASDDEELDWHADPFSAPATKKSKKKSNATRAGASKHKGRDADEVEDEDEDGHVSDEDEDDEDDGPPIFGDMDLDAPSGESDNEDLGDMAHGNLEDGLDMDLTANDIFYKDFFAPPARKRGDRDRPGRKSAAERPNDRNNRDALFQPTDEDIQRAMNDVRRDLFEQLSDMSDDAEDSEGLDAISDTSAGDVRGRRSAHERRQAKILAEIRRLEAEALREKNWTLAGEASAGARPLNSLLEEDLDFEHTGKPVPVITQEVSEDIEALVKRRILEQSFDEVRRRYGTGFGEGDATRRRGLAAVDDVEIDDQQAKKGLAAVYEDAHQQAANPDTYVSASDERLHAEEREVERMWLAVSAQLDALSNWHYKPRPAAPTMTVVADVAAVAMEDAQPTTAQGVSGGASMLAPQEIYKPGMAVPGSKNSQDAEKGIIVIAKSGLPVARDEMTREEKLRRRRRNKERIRKSGSGMLDSSSLDAGTVAGASSADGGKNNASQQETLATLKKAGVKVIGRKGDLQDLEGNKPRAVQTVSSGNFKL